MASCPFSGSSSASSAPEPAEGRHPTLDGAEPVDLDEAREWLEMFYGEARLDAAELEQRWDEIKTEVARTGSYRHTFAELEWGARVAWRQSVRCIGRGRWQSLRVRDARDATTVDEVVHELTEHLRFATNSGRIRSTITVFRQDAPDGAQVRIANDQLIRYAGYRLADGSVLGDPRYVEFTELLCQSGWQPPPVPSRFDVLPWLIKTRGEPARVVEAPHETVLEVPITHPSLPWFADLELRWHAVPAISNMRLRIGGVNYSCAPFNGFYLVDEIATRNFGDTGRYNQLPVVATHLGLDPASTENFWQVRAAVELNTAVLHSFRAAGVRIEEPVAESRLFSIFAAREEAAGRPVHGDWSWINGHLGATFGPAWHRYYDTTEPNPNFWLDPYPRDLSIGHVDTEPGPAAASPDPDVRPPTTRGARSRTGSHSRSKHGGHAASASAGSTARAARVFRDRGRLTTLRCVMGVCAVIATLCLVLGALAERNAAHDPNGLPIAGRITALVLGSAALLAVAWGFWTDSRARVVVSTDVIRIVDFARTITVPTAAVVEFTPSPARRGLLLRVSARCDDGRLLPLEAIARFSRHRLTEVVTELNAAMRTDT